MSPDTPPQSQEELQKAHFAKATKAILELAADKGGTCRMGDMHSLSESKFFIAHQQFSKLLEDCVAQGLVKVVGHDVTLTEKGQAFVTGASEHE